MRIFLDISSVCAKIKPSYEHSLTWLIVKERAVHSHEKKMGQQPSEVKAGTQHQQFQLHGIVTATFPSLALSPARPTTEQKS